MVICYLTAALVKVRVSWLSEDLYDATNGWRSIKVFGSGQMLRCSNAGSGRDSRGEEHESVNKRF